jgi:hypothetical protein
MNIRLVAVCAIVGAAPFEPRAALVTAGPVAFTATEIVWTAAATVWAASWIAERRWPAWRSPVTFPVVCWLAIMGLAALFAEPERSNAVKATARLGIGVLTAWMVATATGTARASAAVIGTAVAAGLVVTAAAIGEVAGSPPVLDRLVLFREYVRLIGGDVRASGTLQYPTIAAAYLESVLALCTGLTAWLTLRSRARGIIGLGFVLALSVGIALTLTRAAVLACVVGVVLCGVVLRRRQVAHGAPIAAAVCLAVLAPSIALSASEPMRLRWTSEGRAGWYRAEFAAPKAVTGRPGAIVEIPVTVVNTGRRTWSPSADGGRQPFHLSYHIVDSLSARVVRFDGVRTPLDQPVPPGARARATMRVWLPEVAGDYRIAWDVVQEERLWFGPEPGARTTFTHITTSGAPVLGRPPLPPASARAPAWLTPREATAGRLALWRAALAMVAEHPLLGIGPDNFRLRAAPYLSSVRADRRVHANNMYLEVLTGGGIAGLVAFLIVTWSVLRRVVWHVRTLPRADLALYSGVVAAVAVALTHGLVDSFLTFTSTVLMGGVVAGLALAPDWGC